MIDLNKSIKEKQEQINKLNRDIEDVKKDLENQKNKVLTKIVKLSIGTYEVETKIHHLGKTYAKCEKDCSKDWEIATYSILQELRNTQPNEFNLVDTWEFVQQPDLISKKNNFVARFYADSGRAVLYCNGDPSCSYSSLGVRFVRRIK